MPASHTALLPVRVTGSGPSSTAATARAGSVRAGRCTERRLGRQPGGSSESSEAAVLRCARSTVLWKGKWKAAADSQAFIRNLLFLSCHGFFLNLCYILLSWFYKQTTEV